MWSQGRDQVFVFITVSFLAFQQQLHTIRIFATVLYIWYTCLLFWMCNNHHDCVGSNE